MPVKNKRTRKIRKPLSAKKNVSQAFEQEIVLTFIQMLNTVKLYHWKTRGYATHKATDELYSGLNETIDSFVEVLLGKYADRVDLTSVKSIPLHDFTNQDEFVREIMKYKELLVSLDDNKFLKTMSNSDLYNIRDEMLGQFNQLLYLLTFTPMKI
jgi:DNA-binding ferritin-like protein